MTTLKGKPRSAGSWLPSMVMYGVDCSDVDPAKWTPFGTMVDQEAAASAKRQAPPAVKVGQPAQ